MKKVTKKESEALNEFIVEADEREDLMPIAGTSKVFPYIGWYWRDVDFTRPFPLGDCGQFIGFMQSNKWDYHEWTVTQQEYEAIVTALRTLRAQGATREGCRELWTLVQSCRQEESEESKKRRADNEAWFREYGRSRNIFVPQD